MTVTVLAMVHGKQNELWVSVVAVKGGEKEGGGQTSRQSAVGSRQSGWQLGSITQLSYIFIAYR